MTNQENEKKEQIDKVQEQNKEDGQIEVNKPEFIINSESDLHNLAKYILGLAIECSNDEVDSNSKNKSVIVALQGDLGVGKTTFTKYIAKELGIEAEIQSPTFVIMKKYPISKDNVPFSQLVHIDAYRLKGADELKRLNFEDLMKNSSLICLEWPEIVQSILPSSYIYIKFEHIFAQEDGSGRKVTVSLKV